MRHFTTNFAPTTGKVFSISSARMWLISKADSRADRFILALLSAYEERLVTSKLMTLQVVERLLLQTSSRNDHGHERVKLNYHQNPNSEHACIQIEELCSSFFKAKMASSMARGRVRPTNVRTCIRTYDDVAPRWRPYSRNRLI